jgi:putative membrane protein
MLRFLASSALYILANAVGLLVAALLLDDFTVTPLGFTVSVLFFSMIGIVFSPFILKLSIKYMPALRGGIALVTTFVGLLLTSLFTDGLTISGLTAWIMAPLIVWLCVVAAGIVLPMFLFKSVLAKRSSQAQ